MKESFREIFTEPCIKESPEITVAREQKYKEQFLEAHQSQNTPKWEGFFDKLDFEVLKSTFLEFINKHNFTETEINFLDRSRLFSFENMMQGGEYLTEDNAIILDEPEIEKNIFMSEAQVEQMKKEILEAYGSWDIFRLKKLVHEETHAISRNECVGMRESSGAERREAKFSQVGFHQQYRRPPEEGYYRPEFHEEHASHFFHALNEAATERVAREITLRYLEKTGFDAGAAEIYRNILKENQWKLKHYQEEINVVSKIIKKVSENGGVTEEEIWTKIEKGLLQGERFGSGDLKDMFEKTFGNEFVRDLAWLWPSSSYQKGFYDFQKKYNLS